VLTQVMNVAFIYGLHLNHAGLALALGLGACVNAGLLYYHLRKAQLFHPQPGWWIFLLKLLCALVVMGGALYLAMGDAGTWLQWSVINRLVHLTGLVLLGMAVYFAVLFVLGFRPQHFSRRTVR
jgi:putative peptidoglycan lipid II flippase